MSKTEHMYQTQYWYFALMRLNVQNWTYVPNPGLIFHLVATKVQNWTYIPSPLLWLSVQKWTYIPNPVLIFHLVGTECLKLYIRTKSNIDILPWCDWMSKTKHMYQIQYWYSALLQLRSKTEPTYQVHYCDWVSKNRNLYTKPSIDIPPCCCN